MNKRISCIALALAGLLSGCQNFDSNALMQSGTQAWQAATLSDVQVKELSDKSCQQMDGEAQIAPDSSPYAQRLKKNRRCAGR
ncbi:putative metalloprotease [Erwinia amylovora Ea644]|nr:putative metalloprotease [Erwinia amylovora Ea644]